MNPMESYNKLLALKLTEVQLRYQNYPRPDPSMPGKARLYNIASSFCIVVPSLNQRTCDRCSKVYTIDEKGMPLVKEECSYHPYRRVTGRPPRHRCCGQGQYRYPCTVTSQHTTRDIDPDNLVGFVSTKENLLDGGKKAYALDCEMVCTKDGLELASITVVDTDCRIVYETMVLPDNPILDYLTEFNNFTSHDFKDVTTRLEDVHRNILGLFDRDTILIGHAMEHDLLALKLIHDNVVDTVVAYPHVQGRGFRNSLGFLKERHLSGPYGRRNRVGNLKCREDAIVAMKLALLKCK